jgi:hypothetical protein
VHPERIGARDDHEVRVPSCRNRGADALHRYVGGIERLFFIRMLPRAGVVLDVDRGDAGALEGLHRSVERFGVRDHRYAHRVHNARRVLG